MQTLLIPRPRDMVDQIPAGVYEVIDQIFTTRLFPTAKCDQLLESLLRYAQIERLAEEQSDRYAKIAIHNLLKTYHMDRTMQDICCYQTLHTFVRLLCALDILTKQGSTDQPTTYLLPLDVDYHFHISPDIFDAINCLCDPRHTKNPKMRKKAYQVKERLLLMQESPNIFLLGDSFPFLPRVESTDAITLVDSPLLPRVESTNVMASVDSFPALSEHEKREKRKESTNKEKNLPDVAPSSIEYLSLDRYSLGKELELESLVADQWTDSEEELSQEAAQYLMLLDGPEYATPDYLNTHNGKKALGGYKNKIRRSPRLARIAAINALLQRSFYDLTRQKEPLKNAGKWFHRSFDRYVDPHRPMEIVGEILDWAKSPYTLQEIALALPRERKRQETQWWSSEAVHLPFSSCVRIYQHLRDVTVLPLSVAEEQREIFCGETARYSTEGAIGLPSSQGMSRMETEQLADEIRREASWYLEEIHVSVEPRLGENAYVVEAFIAQTTFPVAYASRQDWWLHHQEQVGHQIREEHQKGETYANSPY